MGTPGGLNLRRSLTQAPKEGSASWFSARDLHMYKCSKPPASSAGTLFLNLVDRHLARTNAACAQSDSQKRPRISFHFPRFPQGSVRESPKRHRGCTLRRASLQDFPQKSEKGSAISAGVRRDTRLQAFSSAIRTSVAITIIRQTLNFVKPPRRSFV
jgi:hypothetical protein